MYIRDILAGALRRIGRDDIAADIEDGGVPSGEGDEVVQTMLYCINATEDELARYYFPLKCTETLYANQNNTYNFSDFSHTPVKILKVSSGGKEIDFELKINGITAARSQIEVTYYYAPSKKSVSDKSEFGDLGDGSITALGAAAEYCLICGEASMAEVWETRYREAIDRARKMNSKYAYVPPRRWI